MRGEMKLESDTGEAAEAIKLSLFVLHLIVCEKDCMRPSGLFSHKVNPGFRVSISLPRWTRKLIVLC